MRVGRPHLLTPWDSNLPSVWGSAAYSSRKSARPPSPVPSPCYLSPLPASHLYLFFTMSAVLSSISTAWGEGTALVPFCLPGRLPPPVLRHTPSPTPPEQLSYSPLPSLSRSSPPGGSSPPLVWSYRTLCLARSSPRRGCWRSAGAAEETSGRRRRGQCRARPRWPRSRLFGRSCSTIADRTSSGPPLASSPSLLPSPRALRRPLSSGRARRAPYVVHGSRTGCQRAGASTAGSRCRAVSPGGQSPEPSPKR